MDRKKKLSLPFPLSLPRCKKLSLLGPLRLTLTLTSSRLLMRLCTGGRRKAGRTWACLLLLAPLSPPPKRERELRAEERGRSALSRNEEGGRRNAPSRPPLLLYYYTRDFRFGTRKTFFFLVMCRPGPDRLKGVVTLHDYISETFFKERRKYVFPPVLSRF